ncbi:MAG: type III-B CRISPR module RAMP protein Cmr4 [Bacteroidota bacterium]
MSFLTRIYRITACTNLHVGSGKQSYGIIDNLVQRDAVSNLPVINGSSLKGALREYFTFHLTDPEHSMITYIFGKDTTDREKQGDKNQAGNYLFFDSHLLSLPVRSNQLPFMRTTTASVMKHFQDTLEYSQVKLKEQEQTAVLKQLTDLKVDSAKHFIEELEEADVFLEDFDKSAEFESSVQSATLSSIVGESLALLKHTPFSELCNDHHLPVIARNSLVDGRSENLWYEQIVPRQTVFFTKVMVPIDEKNYLEEFEKYLTGEKKQLVQIGANASIGQGFCQFSSIDIEPIKQEA